MKLLFVDTAGWLALADAGERVHEGAIRARDSWMDGGGHLVSTNFVMDETLTTLRFRLGIDAAAGWWRQVEGSPRVHWEWIDPTRAERAMAFFFRWRDKRFSFTDCTSFIVMRERRIKAALTTDVHFVQAGFEVQPGVPA